MDLFTGWSIILDYGLILARIDSCFLQTRTVAFSLHKTQVNRWTGVMWITCGLLWCFYQLFVLSFWRHPFTADDPLVSKWCNAIFFEYVLMNKQPQLHLGWRKGTFSANSNFYSLATSIPQGCIKLNKCDSKDFYLRNYILNKCCPFEIFDPCSVLFLSFPSFSSRSLSSIFPVLSLLLSLMYDSIMFLHISYWHAYKPQNGGLGS